MPEIRKTLHQNEWWFVVVSALTDSVSPDGYIKDMRRRDLELSKGYGQIVHTLDVVTIGSKQKMNCANTESRSYLINGKHQLFLVRQKSRC